MVTSCQRRTSRRAEEVSLWMSVKILAEKYLDWWMICQNYLLEQYINMM